MRYLLNKKFGATLIGLFIASICITSTVIFAMRMDYEREQNEKLWKIVGSGAALIISYQNDLNSAAGEIACLELELISHKIVRESDTEEEGGY